MSDRIPLPGEGQRLRVEVVAIDDEGRGRGTKTTPQGDYDVAVRGGFPGDHVRAVVERKVRSQNMVVARVTDIYEEGPARVPRACAHRAPCPGCPLHGLERSIQLDIKRQRILDAVDGRGAHVEVAEVLADETGFGTRQRVKLVVGGQAGALRFGLYAPRSHQLLDSDRCAYVRPAIDTASAALKARLNEAMVPAFDDDNPTGLRAVLLRAATFEADHSASNSPEMNASAEGAAVVLLTGAPLADEVWNQLAALVENGTLISLAERVQSADASQNSLVSGDVIRRTGPDTIVPLDGGPAVDADAFCQTDPLLASRMYDMCARFLLGESVAAATRPPLSAFDAANDDSVDADIDDADSDADDGAHDDSSTDGNAKSDAIGITSSEGKAERPSPFGSLHSLAHRQKGPARALEIDPSELEDAHVPGHFLDAYAGTGGFSRALLWLGAQAVSAIEVAGASASALAHIDVTAHLGRVDATIDAAIRALPPGEGFRGVVADPPRKGLRQDVDALAALGAPRFCLVSCDPHALKKDAAALCERGYRLLHVVPIDLFPGTPEVEAVAFFEREERR